MIYSTDKTKKMSGIHLLKLHNIPDIPRPVGDPDLHLTLAKIQMCKLLKIRHKPKVLNKCTL